MIDILSRKLAIQASTNATAAAKASITSAAVPTQAGAVGSGSSAASDQAAMATCFSAIAASRNGVPTGQLDLFQYQTGMVIEPGIYDAGGFTMTDCKSWLKARIPGTVFIRIPAGQYFLTVTGQLMSLFWDGIVFLGGKGAFKSTSTSANANQQVRFTNCVFANYTECAISNNFVDSPFLKVDNCQFGGLGANAGIAWGGYVDQLSIENCAIGGNDYAIAIGPRISGNYNVVRNDLLQNRKADIWIKPNITDTGTTNAGWAGAIMHNKFGNEMQNPASPYPRILIANEDTSSGTDRATYKPLTTIAGDTGRLVMPTIAHNRFAHISQWNAPVIRSYVSGVCCGFWQDNKFDGGQPTYVIEWPNGRTGDYSNTNANFEFRESDGAVPAQFSTHPFGRLFDYASFWPGASGAVTVHPLSDSPTLSVLVNGLSPASRSMYGNGTAAMYADPYGGIDYDLLTGSTTGSGFGRYFAMGTAAMGSGGGMFVEMALQQAPTRSVTRIQVDIVNTSTNAFALRRTVQISTKVARFLLPVELPASASPGSWQMRIYAIDADVVAGTADRFVLGDVIVNSGNGRMGRARLLSQLASFPRNTSMFGGAQGILPTGWTQSVANGLAGVTTTINSVGVDTNGYYVEIALSGTTTAAGAWALYPEVARAVNVAPGQVWAFYWPIKLVSGSLANASTGAATDGTTGTMTMSLPQYNGSDSWLLQPSTDFSPSATYALYGHGAWTTWNSGVNYIRPAAGIGFASGVSVNAVLRFYQPIVRRMA
jgi:hypothetical protein